MEMTTLLKVYESGLFKDYFFVINHNIVACINIIYFSNEQNNKNKLVIIYTCDSGTVQLGLYN